VSGLEHRAFGRLPDGRPVDRFDMANGDIRVGILTYGGIIASVEVPNTAGDIVDVALGFDDLDGWLTDPQYFGAIVGRFANRIRHGRFELDGRIIEVARNHGEHHLHGGTVGFDMAVWEATPVDDGASVGVALGHVSPAGDEGYPGELAVTVTYRLDPSGSLTIDFEAETTEPTVVNLTNHVYVNLAGGGSVLHHSVVIDASEFLEIDDATIPTGRVLPVEGTPMDFREPHTIGERIFDDDEQLNLGGGYDHCYVVEGPAGTLRRCATAEAAGRRLDVATTQPGVQLYSGNVIRPRIGRNGVAFGVRDGLCLETQHFPDSPNLAEAPSTRLDPGDHFHETTVFTFGAA
jgi:aldose 1-epimerase